MNVFIPFQAVLISLGAVAVIVGIVLGDPILIMIGALITAMAITGLGVGLRMRRREQEPAARR